MNRKAIPRATKRTVMERDGGRCRKCRSQREPELHHIHEVWQGGDDSVDNLIVLCSACHDEWTWCEPGGGPVTFDKWLTMPPARRLIIALAFPWPEDKTAAEFQRWLNEMRVLPEHREPAP